MRRGILATRDELTGLRDRIPRRPYDAIYDCLRRRCNLILTTAPVTEAQWRSLWQQGSAGAALQAARTAQGRMLDLLIAHHIDRNGAYRDRAIEELKTLIGWSTWVDPAHDSVPADLCTAEAATAAVVALDWLWEDLTEPDRLRVLQAVRHKAVEPYCRGIKDQAFWYDCYHHWNAVVNAGCGLAALALGDEEPPAEEAARKAAAGLRRFFDALGREGGWDEGIGFWGYALRYVLLFGEASWRTVDDQRILHTRGMDATGLFPVYFTPNGQAASFGGAASVPLHGALYLLVKHYGVQELSWWLDTYSFHGDTTTTGWSAAGLAMLFRPPDVEAAARPALEPVKVFHEIGWAALADTWPQPGLYVAAKTGDLSANHSQRDMNALQLQVDGEMLLTDLGNGQYASELSGERDEGLDEAQARGHNTITVAERDHEIDARGGIVEAQSGKNFRWVACDAGSACGEQVHFIRHVVMIVNPKGGRGRMVLVLDELESGVPEVADLHWHTRGTIELDPKARAGTIVGHKAGLHFALESTAKCKAGTHSRNGDHVLQLSAGLMGRVFFLSVFSRRPLAGALSIKPSQGGAVRVEAEDVKLHFKSLKRHLQLDKVATAEG